MVWRLYARKRTVGLSHKFATEIVVKAEELRKLESYFKRTFNSQMLVKARPHKDDSAEVYLGDEFIGVVFRDDEDGDLSYNFSMAILDIDLEAH
jgi:hypothetical protein